MASRHTPRIADWRIADGVRVEELDGTWLALDPTGGVVYRLEALAAEAVRHVAHRMPLPARLVPAARELAGHGVLEHPVVDRRTALVGAGVVTLTGLAATILPAASAAASTVTWTEPGGNDWPVAGGTFETQVGSPNHYVHVFTTDDFFTVDQADAIADLSILVVAGGGGGGRGTEGAGGGGGAGGVLEVSGAVLPNGSYTVTVGAGGAGRSGGSGTGTNGSNSQLTGTSVNLTALGGGGGGGAGTAAAQGGSGGGGGADNGVDDFPAGASVTATGRSDTIEFGTASFFGFGGGSAADSSTGSQRRAGGGGGAGGQGTTGEVNSTAGAGGAGIARSSYVVSGVSGDFAGGGGGAGGQGSSSSAGGAGGGAGAGAGGYGTSANAAGGSATANTGSGGGGSTDAQNGGDGGSGIVIVRYRLA